MTSNGIVRNRQRNSHTSVGQMQVQISEFLSFPDVFSGNPGETLTGPPINMFAGDDLRIRYFLYFYVRVFLWVLIPGLALAAEVQNLTVVSFPARPAKLPLWLAQEAGLFEKNGLKVSLKELNSSEELMESIKNREGQIYA